MCNREGMQKWRGFGKVYSKELVVLRRKQFLVCYDDGLREALQNDDMGCLGRDSLTFWVEANTSIDSPR